MTTLHTLNAHWCRVCMFNYMTSFHPDFSIILILVIITSFLMFCCHLMYKICLNHFIWNAFSMALSFFLNVQVSDAYVKTLITQTFCTPSLVSTAILLLFDSVLNQCTSHCSDVSLNILAAITVTFHNTPEILELLYTVHNNSVNLHVLPHTIVFVLLMLILMLPWSI